MSKAFPGASIKETWADNQWILSVPAGWSVTIPRGWIVNTEPHRWLISPMPANFTGASGQVIPAGTYMQATAAGDLYVRFLG